MKTIYLDLGMGAAGDMLTAALLELLPDKKAFLEKLNAAGIPKVQVAAERAVKCGITGTHMVVKIDGVEEDEYMHEHAYGHEREHEHEHGHEHDHENRHAHEHGHEHDHENGHEHEHEHEHDHGHEHGHDDHHDHEHEREHAHEHGHEHGHEHDHAHEHDHEHEHDHAHEHDHEHEHDHAHAHHHHSSMHEVEHIVERLHVSERVKKDVLAVYGLIAEAEGKAHGVEVSQIHFHEVGTMDAIADVTAVCMLFEELGADRVVASPVHVGSGTVRCAHGTLPVPAPATAFLLQGIPMYGGQIVGELCTPTGAALLKHFVKEFGAMPCMRTEKIGYGTGKKDFEAANCVRAMLGMEFAEPTQVVYELSCNLDDCTPEALGYAAERLFAEGAMDVYTIPVGMKKNRPGVLLSVICTEDKKQELIRTLFLHTSTLGVRETVHPRHVLSREIREYETPYGTIHRKESTGYGITKGKTEYEDLARVARERGISLDEARSLVEAFLDGGRNSDSER